MKGSKVPAPTRKLEDLTGNKNANDEKKETAPSKETPKETDEVERTDTDLDYAKPVVVKETKHVDNVAKGKLEGSKTPFGLSSETAEETAKRYDINDEVPDDVHDSPDTPITRDNRIQQIPGGTHLHPDVAKDTYNSSLGIPSEAGVVNVSGTQFVYAGEAELDDKGRKDPQREDLA